MSRLAQAGRISVGIWYDMPGFGLREGDGQPSGFEVEIARIVAARLGIAAQDITWVQVEASRRELVLTSDEVDLVVATMAMREDEAEDPVHLAGPYLSDSLQIVVAADGPAAGLDLATLGRRPQTRVCTVLDLAAAVPGSGPETGAGLPGADQVQRAESMTECLEALEGGAVDAVAGPVTALTILAQASGGDLALAGSPFGRIALGVGIPTGDTVLCAFIAETLAEAASSGSYRTAWNASVPVTAGLTPPTLPTAEPCR